MPTVHKPRRVARICAATLITALSALSPTIASATDYTLGPGDVLHVKVAEWQTIEGTFRDWSSVNGDYSVGPDGALSIPLAGEIPTAGKSTADIAKLIGTTLQQKLGLSDLPQASVGIAEYRPFYVAGVVQTPGKYPYVPGLTALQAMSIAGGLQRDTGQRYQRDFISAQGSYAVSLSEQRRLLVRRARISAEAANETTFKVPPEIANDRETKAIIADEQAIMTARQNKLRLQLQALADLRKLLDSEISSLTKKTASQQEQLELSNKELAGVDTLANQGLVVSTRVFSVKKAIADIQSTMLDIDTQILRAKQDINKSEQDAINLQNTHDAELATDRQQVEADLTEANLKLATQQGLMAEAFQLGASSNVTDGGATVVFTIVRTVGSKSVEMPATESTPLLPGDVVRASVPLNVGQ